MKKDTERAIFLLTPEKILKHNLKDFNKLFNYHIGKLLMQRADPFIDK